MNLAHNLSLVPAASRAAVSSEQLHHARILIVDDQPVLVTILENLLACAGYTTVSSTTDARTVAELHREHRYDLIVLDLQMPHMDGFGVLEQLREIEAGQYLPVLVASSEPAWQLRALDAGAKDFVSKPYDYCEMLSRIRNMLEVRLLYTGSRDYGQRMACYDSLTGLANRDRFTRTLEQELLAVWPKTSALLLIDVDGFTDVNATFGHAAGDEVLRQFSQRLARLAPPRSTLGRFGSDEFALLLAAPDNLHAAVLMTEQIREALVAPFRLAEGELTLSASIGVATCPADADEAAALIQRAAIALQQARQDGRGASRFYTAAMNAQSRRRYEMESALRKAYDNGEFQLYYQPKMQLNGGAMVGAEALLRWHRPGHGVVSPAEFIPLLEENGLIVAVGAWAIDTACRQIAAWSVASAGPVPVAVNVASAQFSNSGVDLVTVVSEAIARHRIDASLLCLEVTESALMADIGRTAATLAKLRAMGVHIAIDDFGTGYSSLAYLKRFPVDTLKIDIAFIREVTSNPDDAAVVDAIIAMAHSLHLDVVAEGVETAAQLAHLNRHRCDQVQGYYVSRPLPAAQFEQLMRQELRLEQPADAAPERTLLIIDDEPHVVTALHRLLRQDGYRILTANGAAQAFELLAQNQVQLILCDQRMEEMSGTELLDRVKDMYPDTFRIILSGYTDLKTIMESVNRGALYRFYTKPWDNQTLRDNIRAAFRHYWQLHGMAPVDEADTDAAAAIEISALPHMALPAPMQAMCAAAAASIAQLA